MDRWVRESVRMCRRGGGEDTYIGRRNLDVADVGINDGRIVANGFDEHWVNVERFETLD